MGLTRTPTSTDSEGDAMSDDEQMLRRVAHKAALRTRLGQHLTAIVDLYADLEDEAAHRYDDNDIPGGDALVMLGPAANLATWQTQVDAAEQLYFEALGDGRKGTWPEISDHDSDPAPPLLVLATWEDAVRDARNQPTGLRATVERAADYLRNSIDWMLGEDENEKPNFIAVEQLARDLAELKGNLEAVLRAGIRHEGSAAACFKDIGIEEEQICGGRLVRRTLERRDCEHVARAIDMAKGITDPANVLRQTLLAFPEDEVAHRRCDQGGRDDVYRCQSCKGYYTEAEYWLAVRAHHLRNAPALTAADMESQYRVRPGTLRVWAHRGEVRKHGRNEQGRVLFDVAETLVARSRAEIPDTSCNIEVYPLTPDLGPVDSVFPPAYTHPTEIPAPEAMDDNQHHQHISRPRATGTGPLEIGR